MKLKVWLAGSMRDAELTTERAESSYGQPVLVIGGEAFGPMEAALTGISLAGGDEKIRSALAKAGYHLRNETWGHQLKRLRLERGLSQVEMAEKLGITQPRLSDLEARDKPPRDAVLLRKIEKMFGK